MKTIKNAKQLIAKCMYACSLSVLMISCSNNPKTEDSKDVAKEHNEAKFDNKAEDDAKFLVNAAEINLMEIQLGELATTKGMNAETKELGKMMVSEHTKNFEDLKALAALKMMTIPMAVTEKGQDAYNKLQKKSGNDFDKEFCDMMVDGHKDAIDLFEKAEKNVADAEIKSYVSATLPALRSHLDNCMKNQDLMKKM
ncbi:hypothetical protein BH11BAC2_BH11BAC2_18910 [soil metagenome]